MRSCVEFRSAKFPKIEGEDGDTNPGRYGKRLAEFLQRGLQAYGVPTGDVWGDDWGWGVAVDLPHIWIGCGNYEEYPDGFLCFVEPSLGYVRRWFVTKIDVSADQAKVVEALDQLLRSDPEIRDIRWWSDKEAAGRSNS